MSGRKKIGLSCRGFMGSPLLARGLLLALTVFALNCAPASAQQRRDREPNSTYASRRATLAAEIDGPIILLGYTGREEEAETAIFAQEENFYYLTGHNEEESALILLPVNGHKALADDF